MPSLDSWIDTAELKKLANRVTSHAMQSPTPAAAEGEAGAWKHQLSRIKAAASQAGVIRRGDDMPESGAPGGPETESAADGKSFLERAAEIHPWAKNLLAANSVFFCDGLKQPWPAEELDNDLLEESAQLASAEGHGVLTGRWMDELGGMLWVFTSATPGTLFWLSVFTRKPASHQNLLAVKKAVHALSVAREASAA